VGAHLIGAEHFDSAKMSCPVFVMEWNPAGTGRRLLGRARQAWFEGDAMMQHAGTEKRSVEARSSAISSPHDKAISGRRVVAAGR
jgi:hypothetical protein